MTRVGNANRLRWSCGMATEGAMLPAHAARALQTRWQMRKAFCTFSTPVQMRVLVVEILYCTATCRAIARQEVRTGYGYDAKSANLIIPKAYYLICARAFFRQTQTLALYRRGSHANTRGDRIRQMGWSSVDATTTSAVG